MSLTEKEKIRYQRQMIIPDWGEAGQEKLREACVFIAGAGGLGSPVSIYLASAGVGSLRICDFGEPELSNLNRQILHTDSDLKTNKAVSARETLQEINPHITVEPLQDKITPDTVEALVGNSDLIVDCLDNFEARHVLNRFAVRKRLPMVHAGIHGLSGQITFIQSPETPCLQCIFPGSVPKEIFPVAGVTPGVIGVLEATEVLKWILGIGTNLKGQLLIWDGELMQFQQIEIKKDPNCPACAG